MDKWERLKEKILEYKLYINGCEINKSVRYNKKKAIEAIEKFIFDIEMEEELK